MRKTLETVAGSSDKPLFESKKTKIELFLIDGSKYVRKTVKSKFAKLHCSHEVNVLNRLRGLQGAQQIMEQDSDISFVSEYIPGETLRYSQNIPDNYFDNLRNILLEIHRRGVADIDFAHSCDLIVGIDGKPKIIDLASSLVYNPSSPFGIIVRPVFNYICELNKKYLVQRQARFAPHTLSKKQLETSEDIGFMPQLYRKVKKIVKGKNKQP